MRSKIVSLLLAFMMIFTLIPATAFAETAGSDLIEVTVNVAPSSADVTFYEGEDAVTPLSAEQVTDNGIVEKYHQYVLKVERGTYSYRGADTLDTEDTADDQYLGGMAFNVPVNEEIMEDGSTSGEGQTLTVRRINFYTTNANITAVGDYILNFYPSNLPQAVNGDQYVGTVSNKERIITPVLALARGNALTYQGTIALKPELAETYGVANIVNYTVSAGTSAASKTFSLAALKAYSITAPEAAKVQMFNQINNFNVEEVAQGGETENEDGTVTHSYKSVSSNLTYRVTMKDKITRAGFFGNKAEDIVVTYDEHEDQKTTVNQVETIQNRMESSTMVNVNGQNNLKLGTGETFRLRAYRGAWEIINTDTANIMIEPDFNYKVISGGKHIEMTPAANKCTGNAGTGDSTNWMDIKGVSAGTAVIEVSYDAIQIGGEGTKYDGLYGATDPQRTSLIVINVGETENTLKMQAAGAANLWDTEYDTVYFTGESGTLNFTATMDGVAPDKVELSTDKGETWNDVTEAEGIYTAKGLAGGNNILRFTKGSKVEYQVVRAAKVTYTVENLSRDGEEIIVGDEVKIVFKGLYTPVSKFSGIYNPGYGKGHKVVYNLPEGVTAVAAGGQYDFITTNSYTVTTGTAGMLNLTGGYVEFNVMGVDDPLGGHRILTDAGVGSNFSAVSTMHTRGVLPDIALEVTEMPYTPVTVAADTEGTVITVTDTDGNAYNGENGVYTLPYGTYKYTAVKDGYVRESGRFKVTKEDYLQGSKSIAIKMRKIEGAIWDGSTITEPAQKDGVYQIGTGAELAWFAQKADKSADAVLTDDISLGGFNWSSMTGYKGTFDGNGHYITDLYINATTANQGLFADVSSPAVIKNLGVEGEITSTNSYAGAIAGKANTGVVIQNCVNRAEVTAKQNVGGITGMQGKDAVIKDCYNYGTITTTGGKNAGGISASLAASTVCKIENCYSVGKITAKSNSGALTYTTKTTNAVNSYYLEGTCSITTSKAGTALDADELKTLAETLGDEYMDNPTSYNGGYPILKWEEERVLPIAKEESMAELAAYKNAAYYREAEAKTLADTIAAAETVINDATTLAAIGTAVAESKAVMDGLKTDAEYTAEELATAKETAKAEIAAYKNAADYRETEAGILASIIAAATEAIENATVITDVQSVVDKVMADMDALKTDAQLTAEELAAAKESAIAEIECYKNADDYRLLQKIELEAAILTAKKDINAAETIDQISPLVADAKAVMDAIKTDAELTAEEELAAAKESGIKEVKKYKNADAYREAEQAVLADIIGEAQAEIEAAAGIADVEEIVEKAKDKLDKVKTDDQLSAEESLSAAERAQLAAEEAKAAAEEALAEAEAAQKAAEDAQAKAEESQKAAEQAKADADATKAETEKLAEQAAADKAAAETAKAEAEAAKEAAEKVLAEAETAGAALKAEAEAAQKTAEEAQAKAEESQKAAEQAKADADATKAETDKLAEQAAADKAAAEAAKEAAESAQKASEENLAAIEALKTAAEKLAEQAAADREAAESAKAEAEKLAEQAAADKAAAEQAKADAEKAKAEAEAAQKAAEEAEANANATQAEIEKLKAEAEIKAAEAEMAQLAAEEAQAKAELAQAEVEAVKAATEAERAAAEKAKADAEAAQKKAEEQIAQAEAVKAELEKALAEVQAKLDALNEVKQLAAPTGLKAKNVAESGKIVVTWKAVKGADEYVVYRAKSKNGAYRKMFTTTGTKYTNTYAKAGTTYYYKVKAVSDSKTVEASEFSNIVKRTCDLKRPEVKAKSTAKKQVKLTWKRVKGADKYVVYRATAKKGTYKKIYTTKKLQLTNIKLKSGKTYYYKVKAVDKDKSAANSAFSIVKKVKCK